jgi:hypothetical protein
VLLIPTAILTGILVDENFKYIVGEVASDEIIFNSRIDSKLL